MEKITNLKIEEMDLKNGIIMVSGVEDSTQKNKLQISEFEYCLKHSKIDNGIIYGNFEIVEVRKKPTLLLIGSENHFEASIANKVKQTKNIATKKLEVGKIYHSSDSTVSGKKIYMYLGKGYYARYGMVCANDTYYMYSKKDIQTNYGDCFLVISRYNGATLCDGITMALEVTQDEMEKFGLERINKAKESLNKVHSFGTKEYVDSMIINALLNK